MTNIELCTAICKNGNNCNCPAKTNGLCNIHFKKIEKQMQKNDQIIIAELYVKIEYLSNVISQIKSRFDDLNISIYECPVCMEKEPELFFNKKFDCQHKCCKKCYEKMESHGYDVCPMCRTSKKIKGAKDNFLNYQV